MKLDDRKKMLASRAMQAFLGLVLIYALWTQNLKIIVNAGMTFAITFLPGILKRDLDVTLSPGMISFMTLAVFLHTVGALGPYSAFWWYDHLTHTLSAIIVSAAGYASLRAFDEHSEELHLPPRFMFVFLLFFIMAVGVFWEVIEYAVGWVSQATGTAPVLTQYSLEDTMKDMLFNTGGAILVGLYGEVYLTGAVDILKERLSVKG